MLSHFDEIWVNRVFYATAAVLVAAALAVPLRPDSTLIFPPFTEDGYYSLSIARAIAAGRGPALEGSGLTNGFQPLVTLLQALAFSVTHGANLPALRIVAAFGWVTYAAAALLLGRIARDMGNGSPVERSRRGLLASLLALAALPLWMDHFNGLETGLLLLLTTILWRLWQLEIPRSWPGLIGCGALLGVLVLARIDAGFLVVALAGVETLAAWRSGAVRALGRGVALGGMALIISAPWWAFNILVFGSPMPISGQAQQLWAIDPYRWKWIGWALGQTLMPWLAATQNFDNWASWLPLVGAILLLLAALPFARRFHPFANGFTRFASALAITMAVLVLWYGFSSIAFWFYARYLAPLSLLGLMLAATLIARLRSRSAAVLILLAPLLTVPVLAGVRAAWEGSLTHFGTIMFWDQLELVRANVPPEEWVAAGQSGTLGFFRPHVLNMDGKVNPEARAYAGHATDYLKARGVRWFVDWEWYLHRALGPEPERLGWVKIAERRNFLLYRLDELPRASAAP